MRASRSALRSVSRVKARADFLKVQNSGLKWVSPSVILQVAPAQDSSLRIGFTVSRKVHKSAVIRNRIRRRLRAAAADILPQHAKPGFDYVLVGRMAALDKPYADILKDILWCLRRLGQYHD